MKRSASVCSAGDRSRIARSAPAGVAGELEQLLEVEPVEGREVPEHRHLGFGDPVGLDLGEVPAADAGPLLDRAQAETAAGTSRGECPAERGGAGVRHAAIIAGRSDVERAVRAGR
jgi:hypothetical protein